MGSKGRILLTTVLFVLSLAMVTHSAEFVTSTLWTGANDVIAIDNYAYCNFESGLMILDISEPEEPVRVSQLMLAQNNRDIDIRGDYAYVANGDIGLQIVNITDRLNPFITDTYSTDNSAKKVIIVENLLFLITEWTESESGDIYDEVLILDITDPVNPVELSTFHVYYHMAIADISVADNMLVATYSGSRLIEGNDIYFGGLETFDISEPSNPVFVNEYQTHSTGYKNVYFDGLFAYVTNFNNGLMIFNMVYQPSVFLQGTYEPDGFANDVVVVDNYAYLTYNTFLIDIVDISDPNEPTLQFIHCGIYPVGDLFFDGEYFYSSAYNMGIEIWHLEQPTFIDFVGIYETPYDILKVTTQDNLAYVSTDQTGLQMLDISDPYQPEFAGEYDSWGRTKNAFIQGDYAYLSDYIKGLEIVHVIDPESPAFRSMLALHDEPLAMEIHDGRAYVADGLGGLRVVNVSDPDNPYLMSYLNFQGYAENVCIHNNMAFVACDAFGVRIVDISDPHDLSLVGTYNTPGRASSVCIEGNYAFIADGYMGGMVIIDISNPANPQHVGSLDFPGTAYDIKVHENKAYVTAGDLYEIDISNPEQPILVETIVTPHYANGIEIAGEFIYVADGSSVIIYRINSQTDVDDLVVGLPQAYSISQNYPNPFNATTQINYNLPRQSQVSIDIYDMLGRKIETLQDGVQAAGNHQVEWNASEVSSGVYFYRITADGFNETNKMMLVK